MYSFLSSYLVIAAEGGLLGIEQTLPPISEKEMDPRTLDMIRDQLFNYMKILTCATIACIQLQERTLIETFLILSFVIAGVIAPVGLAWIKGDGWLERLGFKDSTSASVVYMCGGVCGFVGNLMLGPRFSIFSKQTQKASKTSYQMQRIIERKQKKDMRNEIDAFMLPFAGTRTPYGQRYDYRSQSSVVDTDVMSQQMMSEPIGDLRSMQPGIRADTFKQPQGIPSFKNLGKDAFPPFAKEMPVGGSYRSLNQSSSEGSIFSDTDQLAKAKGGLERKTAKKEGRPRSLSSERSKSSANLKTKPVKRRQRSGSVENIQLPKQGVVNDAMSFGDSLKDNQSGGSKTAKGEEKREKSEEEPPAFQYSRRKRYLEDSRKEGKTVFDSVRNIKASSSQFEFSSHLNNTTANFKEQAHPKAFPTPMYEQRDNTNNNSLTLQTGKRTNKSSFISTEQTLDSSEMTFNTNTTQYHNIMQEIKEKFSEFRTLDNNELELVLHLYDSHFSTPHQISNSAYYVSGALIVLVSFMFINAQNFRGYDTSQFGLTPEQTSTLTEERGQYLLNEPQKVIMITIMAMSTSGLSFIAMRSWFNTIIHGNNFGCFYITNAMLSGAVSTSASCDAIEVWHAVIISLIGSLFYSLGSKLLLRSEVDDPQEAFLIFGVQGLWSTLAVGFFDRGSGLLVTTSAQ